MSNVAQGVLDLWTKLIDDCLADHPEDPDSFWRAFYTASDACDHISDQRRANYMRFAWDRILISCHSGSGGIDTALMARMSGEEIAEEISSSVIAIYRSENDPERGRAKLRGLKVMLMSDATRLAVQSLILASIHNPTKIDEVVQEIRLKQLMAGTDLTPS